RDPRFMRPTDLLATVPARIRLEIDEENGKLLELAHTGPQVVFELFFLPGQELVDRHRVSDAAREAQVTLSFALHLQTAGAVRTRDAGDERPGCAETIWRQPMHRYASEIARTVRASR